MAQSFAGVVDVAITTANTVGLPSGFTPMSVSIPAGGSETITIAQRKSTDPVRATYRVIDAAGILVDVYEPAVDDGRTTTTDAVVPHTHYDYDASGNETAQADANGHVTTWTYDADGRELSRTLPGGGTEHYTYDPHGNVKTHVDFAGNTATYVYVPAGAHAGMVDHVTYARPAGAALTSVNADQPVVYTYEPLGRPLTTADVSGTTTDHYDPTYGELVQEDTPEGTVWHVYDPKTGRHTDTHTEYTDTAYRYDAQGRLWTVTAKTRSTPTGAWSTPRTTTYTYDAAGNKQTETLPNGDVTTYTYDGLNRLTDVVTKQGTTVLFAEHFTLNADGTRWKSDQTRRQPDGSTLTLHYAWTYDAAGRLASEALTASDASLTYSDTYAYDLAGNRTSDVRTGTGHGSAGTTAYSYTAKDQLTASGPDADGDGVPDAATDTTYAYDPNGSQTKVTAPDGSTVSEYGYDARNKMVLVTIAGKQTRYVYDDAGNRVRETADADTTSAATTYYLTDTANPTGYAQPVEERASQNGAPTLTYAIGDHVYGQAASETPAYFLIDGHGSTIAITSDTGSTTQTLAYTAYGDALNFSTVTVGTAYLFGGDAMYDPASGLYLHGDGTRGRDGFRFVEADREGSSTHSSPRTLSLFNYGHVNPVFYSDPTGRYSSAESISTNGIGRQLLVIGVLGISALTTYRHFEQQHARVAGGVGGFDITNQLVSLRRNAMSSLESPSEAAETARHLQFLGLNEINPVSPLYSWDIIELFGDRKFQLSPIGTVQGTVTVRGKVFYADEVNYYWFGVLTKLQDSLSSQYGRSNGNSIETATSTIERYRRVFWGGTNYEGRVAWFMAGYHNDIGLADGYELKNVQPGTPSSGNLIGRFGNGDSDSSVINGYP